MTNDLLATLNDISKSLAILAFQIKAEALAGLGSRPKVVEHVLLPVLRRIYDAPGLTNTNLLSANFPGVDLYDPLTGLGVQITSESTAAKVAETIETLVAGTLPLKRLVIALGVEGTPRYTTKTRAKWEKIIQGRFAFEPELDVLAFDRLLSRIQLLPSPDTAAIAAELRCLVRGTHMVHLLPHLQQQVRSQLAEERRIARYIPDVFVETQETKYQARCFAHPGLFLHRIAGWSERRPFAGLNRLLTISGLPPVSTPTIGEEESVNSPEGAIAVAQALMEKLERLDARLAAYDQIGIEGTEVPCDAARAHVFEQTKYDIRQSASWLRYVVGDRRTELRCITSQFFLLTGPAGQGKTNFLCDFAERFLIRHGIPSAYVTARQLSRIPHPDLTEVVRRLIFPSAITSLEEGLANLALACTERRQPFILVIDGLNEHPDVRTFAGQLEHLLQTLVRYPYVRVIMTCRSEFLEPRFGKLLSGPLAPRLQVLKAYGQRFENEQYSELVARYFRFFRVRPRLVRPRVVEFLQRDVLLLRFFCEAYGARDRSGTYEQPLVTNIFRDEIFRRYIEDKLGRAHDSITNDRSIAYPLARRPELRRVLSLVAAHMLNSGQYTDVPRSVVPAALDAELTALLDEELVLRHDLSPTPTLLKEPAEVLNFTFDEMRDFLLAQHLLDIHAKSPAEFGRLVAAQQPMTAQSIEGIQRFLFYASRVPTNYAFFKDYRSHPWYARVYDDEVFAVPPTHLDTDDRSLVKAALVAGGNRARHFARKLAMCWETSVYPILNLELLLAVAHSSAPSFYTDVIGPTFSYAPYDKESLGDSFCNFVTTEVLHDFAPDQVHPYEPIFNLLLLLLPIGATPLLDSPAFAAFHQLLLAHPQYGLRLLNEAIEKGQRWHRAFLWRLLSMATRSINDRAALIVAAKADVASDSSDATLRSEAAWFLTRIAEP